MFNLPPSFPLIKDNKSSTERSSTCSSSTSTFWNMKTDYLYQTYLQFRNKKIEARTKAPVLSMIGDASLK